MKKNNAIQRVRLGSAKTLTKLGVGGTTEQMFIPAAVYQP